MQPCYRHLTWHHPWIYNRWTLSMVRCRLDSLLSPAGEIHHQAITPILLIPAELDNRPAHSSLVSPAVMDCESSSPARKVRLYSMVSSRHA